PTRRSSDLVQVCPWPCRAASRVSDRVGQRAERGVHVVAQATVEQHQGGRAQERKHATEEGGVPQGQTRPEGARPQGHSQRSGSLSTYPAPRTVWSSFGAKSASIFL